MNVLRLVFHPKQSLLTRAVTKRLYQFLLRLQSPVDFDAMEREWCHSYIFLHI